jgi:hypothetical protein
MVIDWCNGTSNQRTHIFTFMLQFGKVYEASMKEVHEDCRNGRSIMLEGIKRGCRWLGEGQ